MMINKLKNISSIFRETFFKCVPYFQSNVAIYGRRSEPPTITNYDWVHMITETGNVKNVVKVNNINLPNILPFRNISNFIRRIYGILLSLI